MNDDIVARLRDRGDHESPMGKGMTFKLRFPIMLEGADEIERLRKEVKVWRKIAHIEHSAWSQCPPICLCLSNDFRKAVRDE